MSEWREITLPREKMKRWEIAKLVPKPMGHIYTYQYFDYLATQFKTDVITPEKFWLHAELAFTDLRNGVHAFTGEPLRHEAADRVPTVERFIRADIPAVVDALFSPEDAAAIKKCKEEVLAEAKAFEPMFSAARRREQEQAVDAHLAAISEDCKVGWRSEKDRVIRPLTAAPSKRRTPGAKKMRKQPKKKK